MGSSQASLPSLSFWFALVLAPLLPACSLRREREHARPWIPVLVAFPIVAGCSSAPRTLGLLPVPVCPNALSSRQGAIRSTDLPLFFIRTLTRRIILDGQLPRLVSPFLKLPPLYGEAGEAQLPSPRPVELSTGEPGTLPHALPTQ